MFRNDPVDLRVDLGRLASISLFQLWRELCPLNFGIWNLPTKSLKSGDVVVDLLRNVVSDDLGVGLEESVVPTLL